MEINKLSQIANTAMTSIVKMTTTVLEKLPDSNKILENRISKTNSEFEKKGMESLREGLSFLKHGISNKLNSLGVTILKLSSEGETSTKEISKESRAKIELGEAVQTLARQYAPKAKSKQPLEIKELSVDKHLEKINTLKEKLTNLNTLYFSNEPKTPEQKESLLKDMLSDYELASGHIKSAKSNANDNEKKQLEKMEGELFHEMMHNANKRGTEGDKTPNKWLYPFS